MKRLLTFLGAMIFMAGSVVSAQEVDSSAPQQISSSEDAQNLEVVDYIPDISLDAKYSYGHTIPGKSGGFGGDGLYLNIDGKISKRFSYSLNHILSSSAGEDGSVFDNTCWLTLSYEANNFAVTLGKDALLVGSFEYDAYDLDSYFDMNSMFYNTFACWQWGVSASWTNDAETSSFIAQVANSPFVEAPFEDNLYAYGLAWRGEWDCYESYWTVNMWEYERGKFVKALNLGNMFYAGDFSLMLDGMLRGARVKDMLRDVTVSVMPAYEFGDMFRLFGKVGWEKSHSLQPYDFMGEYAELEDMIASNDETTAVMPDYILPGEDYIFYGAGLEYFPLKEDKSLRLHAAWMSNNYTGRHAITVGATWKFDVTRAIKNIVARKHKCAGECK